MDEKLELRYGCNFDDLYKLDGLKKLDKIFCQELSQHNPLLLENLKTYRKSIEKHTLFPDQESTLLIAIAEFLEQFLAKLFNIEKNVFDIQEQYKCLDPIYKCNKFFIQKHVMINTSEEERYKLENQSIEAGNEQYTDIINKINKLHKIKTLGLNLDSNFDLNFAKTILQLENKNNENNKNDEENESKKILMIYEEYSKWAMFTKNGKKLHKDDIIFTLHHKIDNDNLIKDITTFRYRDNFNLNDSQKIIKKTLLETNYCIYCHTRSKDSCSHGIIDNKAKCENNNDTENSGFAKNSLNVELQGCPLEEKISEMNMLKNRGFVIAPLAIAIVDNPMIAATGHRICNDCMKSCIYQKQEPVNIPYIETQILDDVLDLPWGFEIYSLLTRWNPLNIGLPMPLDFSTNNTNDLNSENKNKDKAVLVVGLGPAGFTLAHYLLNYGFTVVAIDGLKIEPLENNLVGKDFKPIKYITKLYDDLNTRIPQGFGGVMEYGITVRWNKNYLKVIRLLLERRAKFNMYDGVRFGSNITYNDAVALGFSHIALAMGAGNPKLLNNIPNMLAKGVRMASDFLMSLQSSGIAQDENTLSNLQIRLPIVIIGAGLTAIDVATESLLYYKVQIKKFYEKYESLSNKDKKDFINSMTNEEKEIAKEFLSHAAELNAAKNNIERQDLINKWGGVTIVYRGNLKDSTCYKLNHEEVQKAFEENIKFVGNLIPKGIAIDEYDSCMGIYYENSYENNIENNLKNKFIPAKSVIIAIGTEPNTLIANEYSNLFSLNKKYFEMVDDNGNAIDDLPKYYKNKKPFFMIKNKLHKHIGMSCFGDLHPAYNGNVVKAMASAKYGSRVLYDNMRHNGQYNVNYIDYKTLYNKCDNLLISTVKEVNRLTPNIVEIIIKSSSAVKNFKPGQFFKLQNYVKNNDAVNDTINDANENKPKYAMEGIALTGAIINMKEKTISLIVLEMGGSSDICADLKPGEKVVLMGPTGAPTYIPKNENIMLVGGGLGNAVLLSISVALKNNGCNVLYFAGYKKSKDRYKVKEIEDASNCIVWSFENLELENFDIENCRNGDYIIHGNVIDGIRQYAEIQHNNTEENNIKRKDATIKEQIKEQITLNEVDRILIVGSDNMMSAVAYALIKEDGVLYKYFNNKYFDNENNAQKDKKPNIIASVNSPMQCMMKGICAQCLQKHIDPITNEERYVYSCIEQDQDIFSIDFKFLHDRLIQNSTSEKLTKFIKFIKK